MRNHTACAALPGQQQPRLLPQAVIIELALKGAPLHARQYVLESSWVLPALSHRGRRRCGRQCRASQASPRPPHHWGPCLQQLLDNEEALTLEQLLDEDDLIQECKSLNGRLIAL